MPAEPSYFNEPNISIGALIEGQFSSAFTNRLLPDSCIELPNGRLTKSKPARMIIVASSSIIKNDWSGQRENTQAIPLGFDAQSGEQLGNAVFLTNAVNYLAGNKEWLNLRAHNYELRILSKQSVKERQRIYQFVNITLPPILLFMFYLAISTHRKRKNR